MTTNQPASPRRGFLYARDQPCDRCVIVPTPDGQCICREDE